MSRVRFTLGLIAGAVALAFGASNALAVTGVTVALSDADGVVEIGDPLTATFTPLGEVAAGSATCTGEVDTTPPTTGIASGGALPTGLAALGGRILTVTCTDTDLTEVEETAAYTVQDATSPPPPALVTPDDQRIGTNTPTLDWAGVGAGGGTAIASYTLTIAGAAARSIVVAAPTTIDTVAPLPDGAYTWNVTATDEAGNTSVPSATRSFTVDTTAPVAPTLVQTAGALTRNATPTFAWSGEAGATFTWRIRSAAGAPIQGPVFVGGATGVTASPLPADGAYTFEVFQTDAERDVGPGAGGLDGPWAVSAFTLDTTPPAIPNLVFLPNSPSTDPNPLFGWAAGEPGARFSWQVVNSSGGAIASGGTTGNSANPRGLVAGTHSFRVWQIDRAGNASARAEAIFTITNPRPVVRDPFARLQKPRTRLAGRLRPRVGAKVSTASALLRWYRPTRRTVLYNLQVFRMSGNRLTKIHSVFPRGTRYRVPARLLRPNTRYVYQIWAYEGPQRGYLKQPIGISYFDKLKTRIPPKLLAPRGNHVAGRKLVVRWRKAPRTRYYQLQLYRGSKRIVNRRVIRNRSTLAAKLLRPNGLRYRIVIRRGIGAPRSKRYVKKAWAGKGFNVVKPRN